MCFYIGVRAYSRAHFGRGTGPIFFDNMRCSGSEAQLISCSHNIPSSSDDHSEDAGVRCTPGWLDSIHIMFASFIRELSVCILSYINHSILSGWRCEASWRPFSI